MRLTWLLLIIGCVLIWHIPRYGAAAFAGTVLILGLAMYAAPLQSPGPYWLLAPATATIIAGVLLIVNLLSPTRSIELILFLWPLVFPIGVGLGLYAWVCLEPRINEKPAGEMLRAVLMCIRVGLALSWALVAWTYLVLNVRGIEISDTLVVAIIVLGIVAAILIWIVGRERTLGMAEPYRRLLLARQKRRRNEVTADFFREANACVAKYADAAAFDPAIRQQKLEQVATRGLTVPHIFDADLACALSIIHAAEREVAEAVDQKLDAAKFDGALNTLNGWIKRFQDQLALPTPATRYAAPVSSSGPLQWLRRHAQPPPPSPTKRTTIAPNTDAQHGETD